MFELIIYMIVQVVMLLLIFAGFIQFYAGGQQPDQKVTVPSNILQGQFEIVGKQVLSPHWIDILN